MEFRSVAQLNADVVRWSDSLPRDVDVVVGVPRSGMLVATLLALHMDRPLTDLGSYVTGRTYVGGNRTRERHGSDPQRALVVDDSVWSGRAIREARSQVQQAGLLDQTTFGAVYVGGSTSVADVDHWHERLPSPRVFEWNVLHHDLLHKCCMDIDGVLCRDPRAEENDDGPAYTTFLETVPARLVPGEEVGWLVTSRLERYRPQTEAWLAAQGIRYRHLIMHPAATRAERVGAGDHAVRKATAYVETGARLFIESDVRQARVIAQRSGKPVYCTDTNELVQPSAAAAARRDVGDLRRRPARVLAKVRRKVRALRRRLRPAA